MEVHDMTTRYINMAVVINSVNKNQSYYIHNGAACTYFGKEQLVETMSYLYDEKCYFYSAELVCKSGDIAVYTACVAYDKGEAAVVEECEEELFYAKQALEIAKWEEEKEISSTLGDL